MRMSYYFGAAAALTTLALLVSAWLGISGHIQQHFKIALITAIAAIGTHTLLIMFMIVTGRVLREAIENRALPEEFLDELNSFFARKRAYPAAILGATSIVVAGVLAYGQSAFGLPAMTHMLAGVAALIINLFCLSLEMRAILENQGLVDRAQQVLDELDRTNLEQGIRPENGQDLASVNIPRSAMVIAITAWLPYLYWSLIVWRGDFTRTSIHPWVEISVIALLVSMTTRRMSAESSGSGTSGSQST